MRKSIKKNKKALLMAAVLSALEVGSVVGNVGLPMTNVAEAADNHPDIFVGRHQTGNGDRVGVPVYLRWNMSANRYGIYIDGHGFQNTDLYETIKANPIDKENIVKQTGEDKSTDIALAVANAINAGQITASSVSAETINQVVNSSAFQSKLNQKANTSDVTNAENRAKTDAQNRANTAQNNAKAYTDNVAAGKTNTSLNNLNDAGKQVVRDLAKEGMKQAGIDATGDTIIVNKPMDTEDINANGSINATGEITAGDTIHGKGNLEIDGDSHIKGGSEIEKNQTVHGDERIDGNLNVGNDATFEKNVLVTQTSQL